VAFLGELRLYGILAKQIPKTSHLAEQRMATWQMRPHACNDGVVYIGHLVIDGDGNEVEVFEAVPCRRCAGEAH